MKITILIPLKLFFSISKSYDFYFLKNAMDENLTGH